MSDRKKTYDVFLTNAASATNSALKVEAVFANAGLRVFSPTRIPAGAHRWERLREELGASLSVVAVLGEHAHLPANLAIEVGAALAWNKATYAVLNDSIVAESGVLPADVRVVQMSDLDRIVRDIRQMRHPLTPDERQLLAEIYTDINIPTDQLPRSPEALSRFTDRFNKVTGRGWSSERVLREMLVIRKSGHLPKLRRGHRLSGDRISA